MKVYLLMEAWEEYMNSELYGVYSSKEKAIEKVKTLYTDEQKKYYDTLEDFIDYEFNIIPFVLDEEEEK